MIDVLIQGRIRGTVTIKPTQQGKDYAIFRLSTTDKNGDSILCGCITFEAAAVEAVQRLGDGDSVAVSGSAAPHSWRDRQGVERLGLDVHVYQAMSPYHAARKRPGRQPQDGENTAG